MSDAVTITFNADISDLQRGMQQAAASVDATTAALRSGASQLGETFASVSQAYARSATQGAETSRAANATLLSIAREQANAQYQIALDGVKMQEALVKEQAQTAQISHEQQLQSLLGLENQREALERRHLQAVQATYAQNSAGSVQAQQKLEEAEAEGALRRQQIALSYNREIYADYRHTFDQIGSAVSSSIMGMIEGHEKLRQAAQKILLTIVQDFIQSRIRMVADWLAGQAAETQATIAAQAAQTGAVAAGQAAQTAAVGAGGAARAATATAGLIPTLISDARAAFGGVFAFLAPIIGPAAAGPAAAASSTVLAGGLALGAWELPRDMVVQAHRGEMVVPAGVTPWAQGMLSAGGEPKSGGGTHYHNWQVNVSGARKPSDVVDEIAVNVASIGKIFSRQFGLGPV